MNIFDNEAQLLRMGLMVAEIGGYPNIRRILQRRLMVLEETL